MRLWPVGKIQKRALAVVTHAANTFLAPLFSPVLSLLVVRLASAEVWGEFVTFLIVVQFGAHIVGWGNQEYLLREFSRAPARLSALWQTSLWTRALLLAMFWVALAAWFGPGRLFWLWVWSAALGLAQSHKVLVNYDRAFGFALLVDVSGVALTVAAVFVRRAPPTADFLIALFAMVTWLQGLALLWRFRGQTLSRPGGGFDPRYFRLAFPFFLLGFSGLLQSRADLYVVNYFLPRAEVAQYQVFVNFVLYLQALANVVLLPFVRSLYRLGTSAIPKVSVRLTLLGLALLPPSLLTIYYLLAMLYGFHFPLAMWISGGLLVLPVYAYLPVVYALYKANRAMTVLWINLGGSAISLLAGAGLLPLLGMTGAAMAAALAQWAMLALYLWLARRLAFSGHVIALPKLS